MAPQVRPPVSTTDGELSLPRLIFSKTYTLIMTPLIFISFLVSLAIVDIRYSVMRSHYHADSSPSSSSSSKTNNPHQTGSGRIPSWLHRILFKYKPYQYTPASSPSRKQSGNNPQTPPNDNEEKYHGIWGTYYRTKQRKLMKMEAADAFEIRNTVLAILGVLSICLIWSIWRALSLGVYVIWSRI